VVPDVRPELSSAREVAAPSTPAPIVTTSTTGPVAAAPAPPVTTPPAAAPPATSRPAAVAFTASQAYGSCSEPVPYDIFSGTASPGVTVTVSSPYGSGSARADGGGNWEQTVEFPGAPRGETFPVSIVAPGGSTTLSFVATGDVVSHT
jgi:hypothetical protein